MDQAKTILIVEDSDLLLELLAKGFARFGWQVLTAGNGLDGWDLFNREPVDIVLTDIRMPRLNGIELARKIRNLSQKTKIALMSGADDKIANDLIEKGTVDWFFKKPFPLSQICKLLTAENLPN